MPTRPSLCIVPATMLFLAVHAAAESPAARPGPGRLPGNVEPASYDLHLRVDPALESFSGDVTIQIQVLQPTQEIYLHARDMTRLEASIVAGGTTLTPQIADAAGPGSEPESGEKVLRLSAPLGAGPARIEVRFAGPYNLQLSGLYRASAEGRWYAQTQFEAADARRAFPCFDEPRFKVPFRLSLTIPEGMSAHSGTPEESRRSEPGWTTIQFKETKPLPTYLLAFDVGDLDVVDGPAGGRPPIRGLAARGKGPLLGEAVRIHAAILPILESYFGIPFPYDKLDAAAQLEFGAGAMENAGFITYREELLLVDPATTSHETTREIASVAAHEMAHQWFGDLVTMPWWDDIWLNESFATWMAAKAVDAWHPEQESRLGLLAERPRAFAEDSLAVARAVRQPILSVAAAESNFTPLTYTKGASILTMIEHWIGEEKTRQGIHNYLNDHAWKTATSDDLFDALGSISGSDVRGVAGTFLNQPGVPLVKAELQCAPGAAPQVVLTQSRFRKVGSDPAATAAAQRWRIPVCVGYPAGEATTETCVLLDRERQAFPLPRAASCPAWIHPDAGEYGYYHWAAPAGTLEALSRALRAPWDVAQPATGADQARLELRRMQIALLDQAWSGVQTGAGDPAAFPTLVASLAGATDRQVKEQVLAGLGNIAALWDNPREVESLRAYITAILTPEARRLGWDPKSGESQDDALLRPRVLDALGRARAGWVVDGAASVARRYLASPASVNPDIAGTALKLAAREGRLSFEEARKLLAEASTPAGRTNALGALAAMPAGKPLAGALELSLTDAIRTQDVLFMLAAFDEPARREQAWSFLTAHYDGLAHRLPPFVRSVLPRLTAAFCDAAGRDRARGFFEKHMTPGGEEFLRMGVEGSNQCMALRAYAKGHVETALQKLPHS